MGEKWLETHVRSHIAFACARALRDICVSVVRAHIAYAKFLKVRAHYRNAKFPIVGAHNLNVHYF